MHSACFFCSSSLSPRVRHANRSHTSRRISSVLSWFKRNSSGGCDLRLVHLGTPSPSTVVPPSIPIQQSAWNYAWSCNAEASNRLYAARRQTACGRRQNKKRIEPSSCFGLTLVSLHSEAWTGSQPPLASSSAPRDQRGSSQRAARPRAGSGWASDPCLACTPAGWPSGSQAA